MSFEADRRTAFLGIGAAALAVATASGGATRAEAADASAAEGATLAELSARLSKAPRRRDFKTVPMILDNPDQWDADALKELIAYKGGPKQVWNNVELAGPWMNVMRNSLNAQIFSFGHRDFLAVSATHGPAHLALLDQAMWDKYGLADFAGGVKSNTLIVRKEAAGGGDGWKGPLGPAGNTIPALQERGVVFMACHNAIWELSEKLLAKNVNPDKLSAEAMAAELTNHLIEGAVLTPGIVATMVELQQVGFHYAS